MKAILIIDNDPTVLSASAMALSPLGYKVITTKNPEDASHLAKEVDLVVTEYRLSSMDGHGVAEKVRTNYPGKPIIIFGTVLPPRAERMKDVVYVPKDAARLIETIEGCLEKCLE